MKRCSTCRQEKPRSSFNKYTQAKDGLQRRCITCKAVPSERVLEGLKWFHGLDHATAAEWRDRLMHPDTRCSICGLPNHVLTLLNTRGPWWFFLGKRFGMGACRWMQLGHVVPNDNAHGFVPLCRTCNTTLRNNIFCATENAKVLRAVRKLWDRTMTAPWLLYWLHTEVDPTTGLGIGGRLHRSLACERREEMFRVDAPASTPPAA